MATGKYKEWLTDEGLLRLEAWARDGLTDEQIAANMNISRSTLNEWKKKYSDISDALKRGKEVIDIQVENALLKSALGYKSTETKTVETLKGTVTTTIEKEAPPNVTACIFWLKNRRRFKWTDKPNERPNGEETQNITFEITTASKARSEEYDN